MEKVLANIQWLSADEGGRSIPLQVGEPYYPHISIEEIDNGQPWSVRFLVTPIREDRNSEICFSLLADNEESRAFAAKLSAGQAFHLLEGSTTVAAGVIRRIIRQ